MEQLSFNQNLAYQQGILSHSEPASGVAGRRAVIRTRRNSEPRPAEVTGNVTEIIPVSYTHLTLPTILRV